MTDVKSKTKSSSDGLIDRTTRIVFNIKTKYDFSVAAMTAETSCYLSAQQNADRYPNMISKAKLGPEAQLLKDELEASFQVCFDWWMKKKV